MCNFKEGNWVRVPTYARIFRFKYIFIDEGITYVQDGYDDTFGQQGWLPEECELWSPRVGEWCWFYQATAILPQLAQYQGVSTESQGYKNHVAMHEDIDSYGWDYVEPFVGDLPSFIKDKNA